MKVIFLLTTFFFFYIVKAQVTSFEKKKILEEQVLQILNDFPNRFKNLKEADGITSKISLIGTNDRISFYEVENNFFLSAGLMPVRSKSQASLMFYKWVSLINSLYLKGTKLHSTVCSPGRELSYLCNKWNYVPGLDPYFLNPSYKSFTIVLEILLIGGDYTGVLKFGNGDF